MKQAATGGITRMLKYRGIAHGKKVKLVKTFFFRIVLFKADTWRMNICDRKEILAFHPPPGFLSSSLSLDQG